ncbi:hypothetical protein GCM10027189_01970 [Rufibacter soli]
MEPVVAVSVAPLPDWLQEKAATPVSTDTAKANSLVFFMSSGFLKVLLVRSHKSNKTIEKQQAAQYIFKLIGEGDLFGAGK